MIDFTRAQLLDFTTHFVGNKGLGENLEINPDQVVFLDDYTKETLLLYLTSSFKTDIYYEFKPKKEDISLHDIRSYADELFSDRTEFLDHSKKIAEHLYNQSMHPKIKGGEFYTCYFKDCVVDGELCDAIGLFKTENKDTYLKVNDQFQIECDNGINVRKLDKGCLIFNNSSDKENGYKISIIDTNNKVAECSYYWIEDFLNVKLKENAYYHTNNFIDTCVGFCEEILTEANNVKKEDQMMMLNKTVSYFKDKDTLSVEEFEREALTEPDLISAFRDYRQDFNKRLDLKPVDEFDISTTAVKKNQKYMRSIIKLDKNFDLYIHARHDYIERGYDEEKGLKFYKIYYVNEETK
jgi:hypothetical protein